MSFLTIVVLGVVFYAIVVRRLRVFSRSPLDNIRGPPVVSWFKGVCIRLNVSPGTDRNWLGHMGQLLTLNAHQFRRGLEVDYPGVVRLSGLFGVRLICLLTTVPCV